MREIKFRAWDKKCNRFEEESNIFINQLGAIYGDETGEFYSDSDYGIQLFTGLKDKDGREIYEGDILKWECSKSGSNKVKYHTVTIQWVRHGYDIIIHENREKWVTQKSYWNDENRKVIGNIYENSDLLEL